MINELTNIDKSLLFSDFASDDVVKSECDTDMILT